jgi:hypothetical protein
MSPAIDQMITDWEIRRKLLARRNSAGLVPLCIQAEGASIPVPGGCANGDRLLRYGVLRWSSTDQRSSDGRLFSSAFGEWIRENGGAV